MGDKISDLNKEGQSDENNGTKVLLSLWFTLVGVWLLFVGEPDLHEAIVSWLMK